MSFTDACAFALSLMAAILTFRAGDGTHSFKQAAEFDRQRGFYPARNRSFRAMARRIPSRTMLKFHRFPLPLWPIS